MKLYLQTQHNAHSTCCGVSRRTHGIKRKLVACGKLQPIKLHSLAEAIETAGL